MFELKLFPLRYCMSKKLFSDSRMISYSSFFVRIMPKVSRAIQTFVIDIIGVQFGNPQIEIRVVTTALQNNSCWLSSLYL